MFTCLTLSRQKKWVYNNIKYIIIVFINNNMHFSFSFTFLLLYSSGWNVMRELRWREMVTERHLGGLQVVCPISQCCTSKWCWDKVMTQSLVSMNLVSTWTGWRWWVWRVTFRHLPWTEHLPQNCPPSLYCSASQVSTFVWKEIRKVDCRVFVLV